MGGEGLREEVKMGKVMGRVLYEHMPPALRNNRALIRVTEMNGESSTEATATEETAKLSTPQELKETSEDLLSAPLKQKYRYDWYQTDTEVRINILAKKIKEENVHASFHERSVRENCIASYLIHPWSRESV